MSKNVFSAILERVQEVAPPDPWGHPKKFFSSVLF
jgi:hypothetical protein